MFTIFLYLVGVGFIFLGIITPIWYENLPWYASTDFILYGKETTIIMDMIMDIIIGSVAILVAIFITILLKMKFID